MDKKQQRWKLKAGKGFLLSSGPVSPEACQGGNRWHTGHAGHWGHAVPQALQQVGFLPGNINKSDEQNHDHCCHTEGYPDWNGGTWTEESQKAADVITRFSVTRHFEWLWCYISGCKTKYTWGCDHVEYVCLAVFSLPVWRTSENQNTGHVFAVT